MQVLSNELWLWRRSQGLYQHKLLAETYWSLVRSRLLASARQSFSLFFSLPIPSCLKTSPGDSIQKGGNALVRGGLKFEGNQYLLHTTRHLCRSIRPPVGRIQVTERKRNQTRPTQNSLPMHPSRTSINIYYNYNYY